MSNKKSPAVGEIWNMNITRYNFNSLTPKHNREKFICIILEGPNLYHESQIDNAQSNYYVVLKDDGTKKILYENDFTNSTSYRIRS
jgi:hypothetical protein